jgi:hypothetical protein
MLLIVFYVMGPATIQGELRQIWSGICFIHHYFGSISSHPGVYHWFRSSFPSILARVEWSLTLIF